MSEIMDKVEEQIEQAIKESISETYTGFHGSFIHRTINSEKLKRKILSIPEVARGLELYEKEVMRQ